MNSIALLVTLGLQATSSSTEDEFSEEIPEGPARRALEQAKAKRDEQQQEALGEQLVQLLERRESKTKACVNNIRQYRRMIKGLKTELDEGDRAMDYGHETQNYIPALIHYGVLSTSQVRYQCDTDAQFQKISTVPQDWEPPSGD